MIHQASGILVKAASSTDPSAGDPATQLDGSVQAATFNSAGVYVGDSGLYCITASCPSTGSPVGTLKVQGCNDTGLGRLSSQEPDAGLVTWFDVAFLDETGVFFTERAVSGAGTFVFSDSACTYRWFRLVWTRTSGSITITAKFQKKGF